MSEDILEALGLNRSERELLNRHGFDAATFDRLRRDLAAGDFPIERNVTSHPVAPPAEEDLVAWPDSDSATAREWQELGNEAIAKGQVAGVILNGGMATRFGGMVKGVVEVLDGRSFLALKLGRMAQVGPIPAFLMCSFATLEESQAHLEDNRWFGLDQKRVHLLSQRVSLRLTRDGELFRDENGRPGFFAPGHGDVFEVVAESEAFQRFRDDGGRVVMISNVDNLGATVNPIVVGAHLARGRPVTVEVAPRASGDTGGAPVRHRDRLEVLEGFRFPPSFDLGSVPVFNTNTLIVDAEAVHSNYDLTWFRADKTVNGRGVVQFERLMGEVTSFVDSTFLSVPRDGPEGRFLPVKTPDDLVTVRPAVRMRFNL
jgi:UTP--glucose-1-phosphate uridylyltransferase